MHTFPRRTGVLLPTLCLALVSADLSAATFTVTTRNDYGAGSLRAILENLSNTSGAHTIRFSLPANTTIELESALPTIHHPTVIIDGSGTPGLSISGVDQYRVLESSSLNTHLVIQNLTLRRGWGRVGGGCLMTSFPNSSSSTLVLTNVTFNRCGSWTAEESMSHGGAVHVQNRDVTITNSRFLSNTTLPHNSFPPDSAQGGALFVTAPSYKRLTIQNSQFVGNTSVAGDNRFASGGAVQVQGPIEASIRHTRFVGNEATGTFNARGSAIDAHEAGRVLIEDSLFFGNVSEGFATVYSHSPNHQLTVRNNTFVGNTAIDGNPGLDGRATQVVIRNNSFAFNDPNSNNQIHHVSVVGLSLAGPTPVTISNNLMLPLVNSNDLLCAVFGNTVVTMDHNVIAGRVQNCGNPTITNPAHVRVEALRMDGGPVETLTLRAGSAGLDAGNPAPPSMEDFTTCLTIDARGVSRPKDGTASGTARCDAGAWESDGEASLFRDDYEPVLWRPN
jgi:hypothetical protein